MVPPCQSRAAGAAAGTEPAAGSSWPSGWESAGRSRWRTAPGGRRCPSPAGGDGELKQSEESLEVERLGEDVGGNFDLLEGLESCFFAQSGHICQDGLLHLLPSTRATCEEQSDCWLAG